jgi:hypothetical protein
MDIAEKHVEKYLKCSGFSTVVYEPDGNVPPDFLADDRVAVEVRRLNQKFDDGTNTRGLEEVRIPLWNNVKKLVESLGVPQGNSYYVFLRFSRPVGRWKTLKPVLARQLKALQATPPTKITKIVAGNVQLEIRPAPKPMKTHFVLIGQSDEQSGGWIVEEINKNLQHCVQEKTEKIKAFKAKYPEWWLVLPDLIGYGLDAFDKEELRKQLSFAHTWDKIILLDPNNPCDAFVLSK